MGDILDEYAKALKLSEYERKCLGFYEESESGVTDDEEEEENGNSDTNINSSQNDPKAEEDKNATGFVNKPAQDMNFDWNDGDDVDDDRGQDTNANSLSLEKLMDALSAKNWLIPKDSNIEESDELTEEIEHDEITSLSDIYQSVSTQVSKPAPHDLLSAAIYTLLDEFACTKIHLNGDGNCFECRYKEGFKYLAVNYLEELKYVWENGDIFKPVVKTQKIIEALQLWIYHLSEQNLQLGRAYSESIEETEKLKKFLFKSKDIYKAHKRQHDTDRSKIDELTHELSLRDRLIKELRLHVDVESESVKDIKSELSEAQSDMDSLTKLIIRLRDNGVWDIHGLPMSDTTFQSIFGGNYNLHGKKILTQKEFSQMKKEWKNEVELLKIECDTLKAMVAVKDKEIQKYSSSKGSESKTGGVT